MQVVYKRVADAVPMSIHHILIFYAANEIKQLLMNAVLGDQEKLQRLFVEDDKVVQRREELEQRIRKLRDAKEILDNLEM